MTLPPQDLPSLRGPSAARLLSVAFLSLGLLAGCGDDDPAPVDPELDAGVTPTEPDAGEEPGEPDAGEEPVEPALAFSTTALTFAADLTDGGPVCFDFDSDATVDCEENAGTWDLRFDVVGHSYNLWTNGGIHGAGNGGAFGPMSPEEAEALTSSAGIPGIFRDFLGGTFSDAPWQTYNVYGTHDITPNNRVYVVNTGVADFRVQVLSYYHPDNGSSGHVTVRFSALDSDTPTELTLDATAGGFGAPADDPANHYAYLDLDTGAVLELSDEEAQSNTDWDLGFKRYDVIVNSGASGPGAATAALADDQAELYNADGAPIRAAFKAQDEASILADFLAVTDASTLTFASDVQNTYIINDGSADSWFGYAHGPTGPSFSANADVWWAVRSAEGDSYAKLHVTEVAVAGGERHFTVELFVQPRPAE